MMDKEWFRWLAGLIAAHRERRVVSRARLQYEVRLLQRKGFLTDFRYTTFFHGPYSEGLNSGIRLLEQLALIKEELHVSANGNPYYIITAIEDAVLPEVAPFQRFIDVMQQTDVIFLELAATYDAFREMGMNHHECLKLLRQKKGKKCDGDNVAKALKLLKKMELPHD